MFILFRIYPRRKLDTLGLSYSTNVHMLEYPWITYYDQALAGYILKVLHDLGVWPQMKSDMGK